MGRWNYIKGLHDLGCGAYAYLQPDGGWCLSNAGLIVDGGETLLVDTLTDLPLTGEMLAAMRAAIPAARRIGALVNTHAHPDHTAGNILVEDAEIIASEAAAEEMAQLIKFDPILNILRAWRSHGEGGAYMHEVMGSRFALGQGEQKMPTRTFAKTLSLPVGSKQVELLKVGPAHTRGDVLVYVPQDRVLFTGDVLFHHVHPTLGGGATDDWIATCERILSWDVEIVVPGHGPITDKAGVRGLKDYLEYIQHEARMRFDAGMPFAAAAQEISLDAFRGWADEERIVINVAHLYCEFGAPPPPMPDVMALAYRMRKARAQPHHTHDAQCGCAES